jgi:6-phosphogluconolactonase (cycloisomerase 2 family)
MTIAAGGNVGIGTTSPSTLLEIARLGSAWAGVSPIAGTALFVNSGSAITTSPTRISILSGNAASAAICFGDTDNNSKGIIQLDNADDSLQFSVNGSERARIDSSGRLLVGTSTSVSTGSPGEATVQVNSTSGIAIRRNSANEFGASLTFGKSRNATDGSFAIVATNDAIGAIRFVGDDGTDLQTSAATIACEVDGTPGADDMPGRIVLSTTPSGSATPVERLRIRSNGAIGLGTTSPAATAHIGGNTIVSNVNVAGASYDGVSFSVAGQETAPQALFFSPDGRKMFAMGSGGDDVNEYTLSTPWVVSSATYVTLFSVGAQEPAPAGFFFRADGLKVYVVGSTNDTVYQYALTTPWSIATASYESKSFSVGTQEITPTGLTFKPDGLSMYVVGTNADTVFQYTLSTAWDVSTASLLQSFSVAAQETAPQELSFTADGTRMFVLGSTGDDVTIYNLTTPWDIITAAHVTQFSVAAQENGPTGLYVKPDGTKFYIVGNTNDTVYQYTIPSAQIDLTGTTRLNGDVEVAQNIDVAGEYRQGGYGGTLCRAWVNFNGTGTVAIRASYNVSSITDNGVGDYTVNFATAMVDANYTVVTRVKGTDSTSAVGGERLLGHAITRTTGNFKLFVTEASASSVRDAELADAVIFR